MHFDCQKMGKLQELLEKTFCVFLLSSGWRDIANRWMLPSTPAPRRRRRGRRWRRRRRGRRWRGLMVPAVMVMMMVVMMTNRPSRHVSTRASQLDLGGRRRWLRSMHRGGHCASCECDCGKSREKFEVVVHCRVPFCWRKPILALTPS